MSAFLLCRECGLVRAASAAAIATCPGCGRATLDRYSTREGRHEAQLERWGARMPAPRVWRKPSAPARPLVTR